MREPEIGEFDKLVRVRKWQDVPGPDSSIEQTYDAGFDVWASLTPAGAALFYGTAQVEAGVTHRLSSWQTAQLSAEAIGGAHVVDYAGMRYRVRRVTNINGRKSFCLLDLEQLGTIAP